QGRRLRDLEAQCVRKVMPQVLGYRLLQLGDWDLDLEALVGSAMLRRWVMSALPECYGQLVGDLQQLPVASNSLDAVLLPHTLEFAQNPRTLLREVDRVLCQRGQVILLGFNPLSSWHAGQYMPLRRAPRYPYWQQIYHYRRVCDWLDLLDFEVEAQTHYGKLLPGMRDVSHYNGPGRWLAPFSAAYMIFARKRVVPVTPVRERWRRLPKLGPAVLPEARVSRLTFSNHRNK
ncbi:MAG: methyltransferase domain-containing protein, partial [Salinisphaeraceae bacterium]|nr:methyltransferase domain-containing protein [Salinisphaeraceae bacterium]